MKGDFTIEYGQKIYHFSTEKKQQLFHEIVMRRFDNLITVLNYTIGEFMRIKLLRQFTTGKLYEIIADQLAEGKNICRKIDIID